MSNKETTFRYSLGDAMDTDTIAVVFEKVERAKQEWEATIDSLPELVCVLDERGRVLRASRAIETWRLAKVTDVHERNLHQLLHPNCFGPFCDLNRFLEEARQTTPVDRAAELELADAILDRYLRIRVQSLAAHDRNQARTAVVIQDITYQKTAEAAVQRYTARLEAMTELQRAILAARSPEEIGQAALTRLRQLLPFCQARIILQATQASDCLVMTADANGSTHLRPSQLCAWRDLGITDTQLFECAQVVDDLSVRADASPLEQQLLAERVRSYCSVPLMADDNFVGVLLIAADRPNVFQSEPLAIAHEIGNLLAIATYQAQLYRLLKETNASLQHALHAKQQLIQNVSHELRTPIGVIYGYTGLLEEGELGPLTPDQKQALTVMLKHEEQLRLTVDRLVDLRSADAAQLCRQPIEVADWLAVVLRPWHKRAALTDHVLRFEIDLPELQPAWSADGELLKQVLDNLLDNAFKFSPPGAGVRVVAKIDRGAVLFGVQDEGVGLLPDQINQVFERFYQVDGSATRRFGGMGIGLALCKEIVEAHGGHIWAESAGQGSTFWCAMPVDAPQ